MVKNETIKTNPEQHHTAETKRGADKGEAVRVSGDFAHRPTEPVEMDGLLYLSVPHLSYAVEGDAERNQKRILIARRDGRNGHSNASHNKGNGPLTMIAQILGIHRNDTPFAEIKIRLHLKRDGSISQELVLPPGWVVVD